MCINSIVTCNDRKTKAKNDSTFLLLWSTPEPLKYFSSFYFIVVLKMNSKTQERDKALTKKKRKKQCCHGSVCSELLKFGAYLYFKTNRDQVNNSRCCKGRVEFIIGNLWGSEAMGSSCGGSRWAAATWPERVVIVAQSRLRTQHGARFCWLDARVTLLLLTQFSSWSQALLPKLSRCHKLKENI